MDAPGTVSPTTAAAAWAAAGLFGVIAAFHAAVALGAPWGEYTQGGGESGTLGTSGRAVAAVSCVVSVVMAVAILGRAGRGPLLRFPSGVTTVLAWITTGYAALAVVLNLITPSAAERALWAPVSVVLVGLVGVVMVTTHRASRVASTGAPARPGITDR